MKYWTLLLLLGQLAAGKPTAAGIKTPRADDWMPPGEKAGMSASPQAQGPDGATGANAQWTNVLGNALWFYDAQRAGDLSKGTYPNRVPWRNNSVMDDGKDLGLNLAGGFFDAGDYIKTTFPFTFTMFALAWGALSYGPGIDKAEQTKYYDGTLRWGFDWLMNAHPSDDVLIVQVANAKENNDYWGGDQLIPEPRMSWQINASAPGTDAWASASAAFAMGAMAYSGETWNTSSSAFPPATIKDADYAAKLLDHAKSLYKTATTVKPFAVYSDTIPHMAEAYGSSYYTDDLITAALTMAAATNEPEYYKDGYNFYTEFALSHNESMWGWESRLPAGYVLFAEIAHARPTLAERAGLQQNLTGWQAEAEYYFDNIVDGKLQHGGLTPGGLLNYGQLSDLNSLQPALAGASLLFRYAPLASTPERQDKYKAFAQTQLDYWLGKNPLNAVYMIGLHPNAPKKPHSAPASGMQFDENWGDLNAGDNMHVLYGGIVGGPLIKDDSFNDIRDDWVQSEIALDYSANAVALAAYALTADLADPYYVSMTGTYAPTPGHPCDHVYPCDANFNLLGEGGVDSGVRGSNVSRGAAPTSTAAGTGAAGTDSETTAADATADASGLAASTSTNTHADVRRSRA